MTQANSIDQNPQDLPESRVLVDSYKDWVEGEKIPVHLDFGHNLLELKTDHWELYEAKGCFAHTHGAGDFMSNYVLEVSPTSKTKPINHLYEVFCYVLEGQGSTKIWLPSGEVRIFEWGPKALFAIPLNCPYQIFNSSGQKQIRISCTNNAPITLNLYHNIDFVFNNTFQFPERLGQEKHFDGDGDLSAYTHKTGVKRNVWETNFVHDLTSFQLYELEARGKGSSNISFILADGTMHAHVSQIPSGRYKKAHRHAAGTHVHAVDGEGYSLLWFDGDSDFKEFPWQHGFMYTPPFWMFHQHFNTCPHPARYLACSLGSRRYPFISLRRKSAEGAGSKSLQDGGRQLEYEDQDPRIHRKWLDALNVTGVKSQMGEIFDEPKVLSLSLQDLTGVIKMPKSNGLAI